MLESKCGTLELLMAATSGDVKLDRKTREILLFKMVIDLKMQAEIRIRATQIYIIYFL